jgi:outer membrane murein-binding lipoprotein Lpp
LAVAAELHLPEERFSQGDCSIFVFDHVRQFRCGRAGNCDGFQRRQTALAAIISVAAIPPTIPAFATISTFAAALVITTTLAAAISTFTAIPALASAVPALASAIAALASAIAALASAVPALASAVPALASAITTLASAIPALATAIIAVADLAFSALIRAGLDYVVLAILTHAKTGAIVVCAVTASPSAFCREVGHAE